MRTARLGPPRCLKARPAAAGLKGDELPGSGPPQSLARRDASRLGPPQGLTGDEPPGSGPPQGLARRDASKLGPPQGLKGDEPPRPPTGSSLRLRLLQFAFRALFLFAVVIGRGRASDRASRASRADGRASDRASRASRADGRASDRASRADGRASRASRADGRASDILDGQRSTAAAAAASARQMVMGTWSTAAAAAAAAAAASAQQMVIGTWSTAAAAAAAAAARGDGRAGDPGHGRLHDSRLESRWRNEQGADQRQEPLLLVQKSPNPLNVFGLGRHSCAIRLAT